MTTAATIPSTNFTVTVPNIDLKRFKGILKAMGWAFEKEEELPEGYGRMEELSDEECWNYLVHTQPEGVELLSVEEEEEFENWMKAQKK